MNAEAVIPSKRNRKVRIPHDERKRIPLAETVLSNTRWHVWTAMRFGSRFNDAKIVSGINKHPHDLRRTVVTRCCVAGPTDQEIADIVGWDTGTRRISLQSADAMPIIRAS
ncbi:hypothetical protein [Sphingomonas mollis]